MNIGLGMEGGIRFLVGDVQRKTVEERKAIMGYSDGLNHIYGIVFQGENSYAAGDNGQIYIFNGERVANLKFKAENTAIQCLGTLTRNS